MKGKKRTEAPAGFDFDNPRKKHKILASDKAAVDVAKTLAPPGTRVGNDAVRGTWYARDNSIGFSLERNIERWGDTGALALVIVAAWSAAGCECPHDWISEIAHSIESICAFASG